MKSHDYNITPRTVDFDFSHATTKYWLDNCPIKTYFVNTLSLFIPEAEKFFIRSIKGYLKEIKDPNLKTAVKNFIQQEANHSREYAKYIESNIQKYYPKLKIKKLNFPIASFFALVGSNKFRLAMTAVGEHFTAVMSDIQLRHPIALHNANPNILALWEWHCIEEIEHKAVAFDVLQTQNCSYLLRIFAFIIMSGFIFSSFIRVFFKFMRQDNYAVNWQFYKKLFSFLWYEPGFFRLALKPYFAFIKPGFHPWQQDNFYLIKDK